MNVKDKKKRLNFRSFLFYFKIIVVVGVVEFIDKFVICYLFDIYDPISKKSYHSLYF